ncbi:hypothetical protein B0H13DRAFT_1880627 [Mycena leptocephala]|nr:hypothetical protein B0H13DRAFT_1904267 [Mycena leptocephala]KAJ7906395.1 hypothetical protein B0H13DRAFT_1880627 [Mycena leptocephala]
MSVMSERLQARERVRIYGGKVRCEARHARCTSGALLADSKPPSLRACPSRRWSAGHDGVVAGSSEAAMAGSASMPGGRAPGRTKVKRAGTRSMERKTIRESCATASASVHNGE